MRPAWTGEAAVRAVEAGADVILLPPDTRVAIESVVRAVAEGQIPGTARRLGAPDPRDQGAARSPPASARRSRRDRPPRRAARGRRAGRRSGRRRITLVRNEGACCRLPPRSRCGCYTWCSRAAYPGRTSRAGRPSVRRVPFKSRALGGELSAATAIEIVGSARQFSHVVVSAFPRVTRARTGGMPSAHDGCCAGCRPALPRDRRVVRKSVSDRRDPRGAGLPVRLRSGRPASGRWWPRCWGSGRSSVGCR